GVELRGQLGGHGGHREAADAVHFAAINRELDAGRAGVAGDELDPGAEQVLERQRRFRQRPTGAGPAEEGLFVEQIIEGLDAGRFRDAAYADALVHVADPAELGGIEPCGSVAEDRFECHRICEGHQHAAVLRRHVIEPIRRGEATRAHHVLHHHLWIARNMAAKVASEEPRIDIEPGADLVPDHDRERLALVEVSDVVGTSSAEAGRESSESAEQPMDRAGGHFGCGTRMSSRSCSAVNGAAMNLNAIASAMTSSTPEMRSGSSADSGRKSRNARRAISSDRLAKAASALLPSGVP